MIHKNTSKNKSMAPTTNMSSILARLEQWRRNKGTKGQAPVSSTVILLLTSATGRDDGRWHVAGSCRGGAGTQGHGCSHGPTIPTTPLLLLRVAVEVVVYPQEAQGKGLCPARFSKWVVIFRPDPSGEDTVVQ